MTIKMDKGESIENVHDDEEGEENEKEVDNEPEADPVPSAVCIKLFCIDEKYEMRLVQHEYLCNSLYFRLKWRKIVRN